MNQQLDLFIHAPTKFALEQWLDARGLGVSFQDTDPESPTFGQWFYRHTDALSGFDYWRGGSGKLEATRTVDDTDPENPVITDTYYNGFYALLRFVTVEHFEATIAPWCRNNTAVSILDGFNGIGGEGITIVDPEEVEAHLESIGVPSHTMQNSGNVSLSNPQLWFLTPVMTGDEREFGGQTYRSLIDFNVWTPTQYPQGWELVDSGEPDPDPIPEWSTGVACAVNDEVTYQGQTYRCLQAHTSLPGWTPAAVPALWSEV